MARRRAYAISSKGKGGLALPRRDRIPGVGPPASLRHIKRGVCWTAQTRGCAPGGNLNSRGPQLDHWPPVRKKLRGRGSRLGCLPGQPSIVSSRRARPAASSSACVVERTLHGPRQPSTAREWRPPAHQVRLPSPPQNPPDRTETGNPQLNSNPVSPLLPQQARTVASLRHDLYNASSARTQIHYGGRVIECPG